MRRHLHRGREDTAGLVVDNDRGAGIGLCAAEVGLRELELTSCRVQARALKVNRELVHSRGQIVVSSVGEKALRPRRLDVTNHALPS